jgi:hypothetical protein
MVILSEVPDRVVVSARHLLASALNKETNDPAVRGSENW